LRAKDENGEIEITYDGLFGFDAGDGKKRNYVLLEFPVQDCLRSGDTARYKQAFVSAAKFMELDQNQPVAFFNEDSQNLERFDEGRVMNMNIKLSPEPEDVEESDFFRRLQEETTKAGLNLVKNEDGTYSSLIQQRKRWWQFWRKD